ncbi:hypothetical protein [Arthrobacter sp. ISL-30]|uniref:hypothetical protein n=1 Tax=Arthrobacter sp. ISL-30 TaxID=2819109 RepID=UPI002034CB76|nr:hypothetical protein [Arthrobacter sp. ISL-30]
MQAADQWNGLCLPLNLGGDLFNPAQSQHVPAFIQAPLHPTQPRPALLQFDGAAAAGL